MSTSTRSSVPTTGRRNRRPPATVLAAVGLQLLFAAVTSYGVFYFSLVDGARPGLAAGLALLGVYWSANALGVAGSIGLLRRRDLGRKLLIGYAIYEILFSLVKIVVFHESPAFLFGALRRAAHPRHGDPDAQVDGLTPPHRLPVPSQAGRAA